MKVKLLYMTAERLFLARGHRLNRNIAGTFFIMLEKVATENNLSDTPVNTCNIYGGGIQIYNKPEPVITEEGSKEVKE
jgi:hypothetical protein